VCNGNILCKFRAWDMFYDRCSSMMMLAVHVQWYVFIVSGSCSSDKVMGQGHSS